MKKLTTIFLATFCMLCIFFSCKKDIQRTDSQVANKPANNAYSKSVKGDTIIHKLTINGSTNTVVEIKGNFYISDDMLIPRERFLTLKDLALSTTNPRALVITDNVGTYEATWPDAIVYFSYPVVGTSGDNVNALTEAEAITFKKNIDIAIANISASTGIIFKERTNQISYLKFRKHSSENNAWLGYYEDYANPVNIVSMEKINTIMHEILHGLGIKHEHQRTDRDAYLIVDTSHVSTSYQYAFNKNVDTVKYKEHGAFDYESIMLYNSYLGVKSYYMPDGVTRRVTMLKRSDSSLLQENKPGLSNGDIAALKHLYPSGADRIIDGIYKLKLGQNYLYAGANFPFITSPNSSSNFRLTKNSDGTFLIQSDSSPSAKTFTYNADAAFIKIEFNNLANPILETNKFRLHRDEADVDVFTISPASNPNLRLDFNSYGINIVDKGGNRQKIKFYKQ